MASWETLAAFALALGVFAYMPGPALLYTAAQTIARGRRAGLQAALGIHVGGYVHVLSVTLGLSALLAYTPAVYIAIKLAGACYLVWMGVCLLLSRQPRNSSPASPGKSDKRAFVDSIIVEVLNPKAALFFLAFLPQFADPAAAWSIPVQLLVLGIVTNIVFSSADLVTVALASAILERLHNAKALPQILQRAGGALLIGLGVKLAFEHDR